MKTIRDFELVHHGVENSSYFQGCGVSFSPFTDVATGIGNTEGEAIQDALEQLAGNDWDVASTEAALLVDEAFSADRPTVQEILGATDEEMEDSECHWFASLRVRE